ncbi:MAG: hypothetical protein BYD32DRAFT_462526 [Podila humilis]|nr:MAG: hypothetical protein BYD32DRAFT_462526 [Podila humilis]
MAQDAIHVTETTNIKNIGSGKGAKGGGKSQSQILRSLLPNDHRIQRQGQPKSQLKPQFKHLPGPDPSRDACRDQIETCHYADVLLHHKKANYMLLAGQGWCVWVPESRSPNVSSQLTDAQLQRVWVYLHATEEDHRKKSQQQKYHYIDGKMDSV